MMRVLPIIIPLVAFGLLGSACTLPRGSFARPVQPAGAGSSMIAAGVMVPFAIVGGGGDDGDSAFGGATTQELFVIPAVSFDYAINDRHYFGLEVSTWASAFATTDSFDAVAVFVNPRWEYAVADNLSITVDGNLGYLGNTDSSSEISGTPFISPTFGIRYYIPTGFGGPMISQQITTGFITLALPGSLAYDLPIPLGGDTVLHIFPEIRWDPTILFVGDAGGFIAFFSGGMSFMLEI